MTLAYVHGPSTVPLIGETIGAVLNDMAERYGDRLALISCHQDLRYTYAELRAEVDRAARAFLDLGVNRGDRIGIYNFNTKKDAGYVDVDFLAYDYAGRHADSGTSLLGTPKNN